MSTQPPPLSMSPTKRIEDILKESTIDDLRRTFESMVEKNKSRYDFPLVVPPFNFDELLEAVASLLTTKLTMGEKVFAFEDSFAKYVGLKNAIMVNSGSSANLVALAVLSNPLIDNPLKSGDEVIVPALTWSTSVFPILDVGCTPVFVDSKWDTLNMDVESVRQAISPRTRAIMAVHLLGNPCALDELRNLANEEDLYLIEDCCEAHGAEFRGRSVGTWGEIGTFSFFFSHHISTIEGGMIVTNNDEFAEIARALRAHGWTRHLRNKEKVNSMYPKRDSRFLFVNRGYNFRPTEVEGAFGIHQIKKLDSFVESRRRSADRLAQILSDANLEIDLQQEQEGGKHSWFAFALLLRDSDLGRRTEILRRLEKQGIETRPIMAGNMASQPAMTLFDHKTPVELGVAKKVDMGGLLVGLHHKLGDQNVEELGKRIIASFRE